MAKGKLLIWGGNRKELALQNLDSHASVSAYFLTKYLSQYYDIVNLVDMDRPEQLLSHIDVNFMLSTFQYGFTGRIVQKDKQDLFIEIRKNFKSKLCSIVDDISNKTYYEDILFTVLPPPAVRRRKSVAKKCFNKNIIITRMGWSADPSECFPAPVLEGEINIFVDHPAYSPRSDCTLQYFRAFKRISRENPNLHLNVYQQNNQGIVKWDFISGKLDETLHIRSNKVPWKEIIEYYKKTHIFCVTHPESAGLSVIEAAMCGAKIYVPVHRMFTTFISKKLIKDGISFTTFRYSPIDRNASNRIVKAFKKDLTIGFDRDDIHQRLSKTNSWEIAAKRIHTAISQYCFDGGVSSCEI